MATDIVQSLFGVTPEMYQQRQAALADERALQYAKLDPFQQANYAIGRGAYGLAGALGGALGAQDPQLQLISARNSIARQIDYNNPESIMQGVESLSQAGDTVGAMQLAAEARRLQSEMAQTFQRTAAGQASLAAADKAARDENTVVVGNALIDRRTGEVIYRPPEGGDKPVVVGGALVDPKTGREIYRAPEGSDKPVVVGGALIDPKTGREIYRTPEGEEKPVVVGGALVNPRTGAVVYQADKTAQDPEAVRKFEYAKTPAGGGFKGTFLQFLEAQAMAGRAPAQPAAPSITTIQDPTNPTNMITIDARRYQGGGPGSAGVIGSSGKTAPAAAAEQKAEQGRSQAQDIIDNLRGSYARLDQLRAIPSTQRSVISNVLASISASGPGQVVGRATGTEEQSQRDIIQSARNQLFAAVKNATGLSAQNLNSNVEFTTWLNSLTDPSKSYQTNQKILEELEKFIASGGKYTSRKGGDQPAPRAAPASGATGGWSVVR
jgi:hypothetical protein